MVGADDAEAALERRRELVDGFGVFARAALQQMRLPWHRAATVTTMPTNTHSQPPRY